MSQSTQTNSSPNFPKLPTLLRRLRIEQDIIGKKRVSYKKLAEKYSVSERTIKSDAQWIKNELPLPFIQKAVAEKVVTTIDILNEKKDRHIILKYGLSFLARGLPQKIISLSKSESHEQLDINIINQQLTEYEQALTRANETNLRRNNPQKPVDTTQTNTKTS